LQLATKKKYNKIKKPKKIKKKLSQTNTKTLMSEIKIKTKKNAIVEYLDYKIPVTQLKGPKGNGDMQAAKRDLNAPPTGSR